jgi:hypothetical protein
MDSESIKDKINKVIMPAHL